MAADGFELAYDRVGSGPAVVRSVADLITSLGITRAATAVGCSRASASGSLVQPGVLLCVVEEGPEVRVVW